MPNQKSSASRMDRRRFLTATGAAVALPFILPSGLCAAPFRRGPNDRINLAAIGWGMQGPGNTRNFLASADCQVVAVCDLDKHHLNEAVKTVNEHYGNKDCKAYHDFRELLAREDIDAVMIAVPDHWHEIVATEAARRGKDIYGEKPLAKTISEQQSIVRAVEKNSIIWQTGSWQRSQAPFRKAAEIVRNGLIGKVTHVEVGLPAGHFDFAHTAPELLERLGQPDNNSAYLTTVLPGTPDWDKAVEKPPAYFDFATWLGASKEEPYIKARAHMNWRWNYNTGGGQLMDWIGHHCDIAHWGLGFDNNGPSEVEGHGEFPDPKAIWNTCGKYRIELKYPDDITMTIAGGYPDIQGGTKWIGTDGWVWVNRGGFEGSNPEWKKYKNLPDSMVKERLYNSASHFQNFLDCIRSRKPTITPAQTAHHSAIPGHLGLISMLTGRKIRWNVADEQILDDPEASALMRRDYRAPWQQS
jgi:predicted dehydrogenase